MACWYRGWKDSSEHSFVFLSSYFFLSLEDGGGNTDGGIEHSFFRCWLSFRFQQANGNGSATVVVH